MDLLPQINHKFDMVFADPPYFLSNDGLSIQSGKIVSVNKGKENSNTKYYYEVELLKNFDFDTKFSAILKPNILFNKNDRINKNLLKKYLPTITLY